MDGFGISGVCASELTFDIPAEDYDNIPAAAKVVVFMGGATIAATFYISSRRKSGGVVSFKCYDRIIYTDRTITISDTSFDKNNGTVECSQLVGIIASQCGFKGCGIGGTVSEVSTLFIGKDKVIGRQCRDILNDISAAWCGYFKTSDDDRLIFIPFGSSYGAGIAMIHTAISEGGVKGPIEQIIMTNGTDTFISGNENADVFGTIKINTEFASQELVGAIFKRVKGYVYRAWQCSKCVIDSDISIEIDAEITFCDGSVRIANSIEKTLTASGLLCSCGRNDVVEDEFNYTGALSREINKRIADGEVLGNNTVVTRYQGIVHLADDNKARSADAPKIRYGYSAATADGVVEFDGAIINKKIVHPENAVYDNTEDTITEKLIIGEEVRSVQYKFTVENKGTDNEAVTAITFPDGTIMSLEGF